MMGLEPLVLWLWGQGSVVGATAFLIFLRVGGLVALAPPFGHQSVPARIKLMTTISLALLITPLVDQSTPITIQSCGAEILVGLLLGATMRVVFSTLDVVGSILGQTISLSQVFVSGPQETQTVIGSLLSLSAFAILAVSGVHLQFVKFILISYENMSLGLSPSSNVLSEHLVMMISEAFSLALSLSLPFIIVGMLYNLTLGVVNKSMPMFMAVFILSPLLAAMGLLFLMLSAPQILKIWIDRWWGFIGMSFS